MKMTKNQQWILQDKETKRIIELYGLLDCEQEELATYEKLSTPDHKPTKAQQKKIDEWKLEQQKQTKLSKLQKVYTHKDNWIITIKDDEGNKLTNDINWLKNNLAKTIFFFSDEGKPIAKSLTIDEVENIKSNFVFLGFSRLEAKNKIQTKIKNAINNKELEEIDIVFDLKKEFTLEELKIQISVEKKA